MTKTTIIVYYGRRIKNKIQTLLYHTCCWSYTHIIRENQGITGKGPNIDLCAILRGM